MTSDGWTFEGYWNVVLGLASPAEIAKDHGLAAMTEDELEAWILQAEHEAFQVQGEPPPVDVESYRRKAIIWILEALDRERD